MKNNTDFINEMSGQINGQTVKGSQKEVRAKPSNVKYKEYFFKEKFHSEAEAFSKYFAAIKDNGVMLSIIRDIENMGDYCDLFSEVNKDFYKEPLNLYNDGIPEEEENMEILYASNLIKLIDTPDKGRSLIANTVIPKNKVIIYETPTVLQIKPLCTCIGNRETSLYRCHHCGIACKMFFTCDGCNVCIFCSRMCMFKAYNNYHRYECYGLQRHFWSMEDTDYSYLSFRMMLYGASKGFKSDPIVGQPYGSSDNNYPFIYMLETNFDQLSLSRINEILYSSARNLLYLIFKTTFFKKYKERRVNLQDLYVYIGNLMVKHYCQAQANNIILKYLNVPAGFGLNVDGGTGKAICPTLALLNHSCTPNAVVIMYYDSVAVKTLRQIRANEEITICYREVYSLLTLSERQVITEEIFFFTCKCYFCEYERNWEKAPYKCQLCQIGKAEKRIIKKSSVTKVGSKCKCNSIIESQEAQAPYKCELCKVNKAKKKEVEKDDVAGHCLRCNKYFNFDSIIESQKVVKICQNLYKATFAIEHVTRLAECYSNIFPPNSWQLLDVYKLLYEKHVLGEEKPLEAIKYGLLSYSILEHYLSRLYIPLLVNKVTFVTGVLNMRNFTKMKVVTGEEFDVMRIFVSEVIKMKDDLAFYVPEHRIAFHKDVMEKIHSVFKSMQHKK